MDTEFQIPPYCSSKFQSGLIYFDITAKYRMVTWNSDFFTSNSQQESVCTLDINLASSRQDIKYIPITVQSAMEFHLSAAAPCTVKFKCWQFSVSNWYFGPCSTSGRGVRPDPVYLNPDGLFAQIWILDCNQYLYMPRCGAPGLYE